MLIAAIILVCFGSSVGFFVYIVKCAINAIEKEARRLSMDDMQAQNNAPKKGG